MSGLKGDYIGFSYNGVHSSDLGIVRVSNGSRFDENLLPTIKDKTVEVPGRDGAYYFGSQYTQRPLKIDFAFDGLTEEKIANIKRLFGDKQIHDLIFDETPYKIYSAKATGSATMKYLVFEEESNKRVYKGEGSVQFTCYDPFARCAFPRGTKQGLAAKYDNIDEWWDASRIANGGNFGDIPTSCIITIATGLPCGEILEFDAGSSEAYGNGKVVLNWNWGDQTIRAKLDTSLGVAEGYIEDTKTGKIHNQYFTGNLFYKIPPGKKIKCFRNREKIDDPNLIGISFTPKYL